VILLLLLLDAGILNNYQCNFCIVLEFFNLNFKKMCTGLEICFVIIFVYFVLQQDKDNLSVFLTDHLRDATLVNGVPEDITPPQVPITVS
jgi:hypothetical protein